jgi:hypothetical protein
MASEPQNRHRYSTSCIELIFDHRLDAALI